MQMRQYLFVLRQQADLTQKDVSNYIYKTFGIKVRYGDVERGNIWAEITPYRSGILAAALGTSSEYILNCEKNEGGYVGEGASGVIESHQLRVGKHRPREEYSESLSTDERAFCEKYYPYAYRVIKSLERNEFCGIANRKIMDSDDFMEIGILALLKSVKYIYSEQLNETDDSKIKGIISHRIKWGISKHIKNLLHTDKRKTDVEALHIEERISENSDDCFYEYIPDPSISVPRIAESSCTLSCLYSYLSEHQRKICSCLISGYTKKDLVKLFNFSETDIGIVTFYLGQIKKYGKILWDKSAYISDRKGVIYCFEKNKWLVQVFYQKKNYGLGYYDDLLSAIELKDSAEYHCHIGDIEKWYEMFKTEEREAFFQKICSEDRENSIPVKQRHSISRASLENPVGISFRSKYQQYEVTIKGKYLGRTSSLQSAVNLRNEAADHILAGDFDDWLTNLKSIKE